MHSDIPKDPINNIHFDITENEVPSSATNFDFEIINKTSAIPDSWVKRNRFKLGLGAVGLSLAATFALNPIGNVVDKVKHEAPYVAGGMLGMEALWIGGAAMMLSGIGKKIPLNPIKIKNQLPEITKAANDSNLFKTGLLVNTVGAIGEFVIPAVAVCTKLPVESWGVLTPSVIDLGLTVYLRNAIYKGIKEKATDK